MTDLRKIPNVGEATEKTLLQLGYDSAESLKGISGEELYRKECEFKNAKIDRCQLYLYRAVAYFVNTPDANPAKCKWQYFKDDFYEPSPCGVVCSECEYFPFDCKGCRAIEGKAFWTQYVGAEVCDRYRCCVTEKNRKNCAACEFLPCSFFDLKDPTRTDEENEADLKRCLENLKCTLE